MKNKLKQNINNTAKLIKDREIIMQTSMLTAMEGLKEDMGYNNLQLQLFADKYVERL